MDEIKKGITRIAKHYGLNNQCEQCVEEMAELTQAISKLKRAPSELTTPEALEAYKEAEKKVIEEIADVYIMIQQLILFFPASEIRKEVIRKVARQLLRIEEEKSASKC